MLGVAKIPLLYIRLVFALYWSEFFIVKGMP